VSTTGPALYGLYLCGSLAAGDFDERASDVDFLAVLSRQAPYALVEDLERMHDRLAEVNPTWRDRIEAVYVTDAALAKFRAAPPGIAVISPGEPFHVLRAGPEWVLTWYPARGNAIALIGPPAAKVIPDISFEEFGAAIRNQIGHLSERIADNATTGSLAYVVLTMCRSLYTLVQGEEVSKLSAAEWAQKRFPQWAPLIREAITWREYQWEVPQAIGTASAHEVRRFAAEIERALP
jgi:predicted nucleotidyltransferase